jgi:hypothetical protein
VVDRGLVGLSPIFAELHIGPTEIASKQLRHSGPDTTYRSYAQIKSDTANDEVNNLFSQVKTARVLKSITCEDIQIG